MQKMIFSVSICTAMAFFAGCSSTQTADDEKDLDTITSKSVHFNMSPELETRAETTGEIDTRVARTVDTNGRSAWNDLLMFWLLDRPNRQSLYPTP